MTEAAEEKRVGWAELFFDLVFVVAVTQVSHLIEADHSPGGLGRALVVFVPVYWTWVGTAVQTNLLDANRPAVRLRIFLVALAAIFMSIALGEAYHDLGLVFAFAYWAGRVVLGVPLILARQITLNPFTISMFLTGPAFVVGGLLHGDAREIVWALAALVDLSSPTVLSRRLRGMHYDAGHLAERFGLFVLIALGESVAVIGLSIPHGHLTVTAALAVTAAFVLSCGLWWVYFHFAADAMRHALATAKVQLDITRLVLSYGHLAFIGSIVVVAVGLSESIAHPGHELGWTLGALLYGGVAVYLATFGFTRWAMFRLVSTTRLTAAAVVLILLPGGRYLPALASLFAIAAVLVVLNVVELLRVEQIGWRALLARRGPT